jgi:hypothetical protein
LWSIYELLWIMSVIAIFRVLPFVCVLLVGWALVQSWRRGIADRSILISIACPAGVILNVALYFATQFAARGHG